MAQEDDLRALGKVMDFMRGISVIFLLINCYWLCILLSQLVAVGIAHRKNWCSFALYLYAVFGLYLPADGWRMDEPTAQKQPDGRCVQHGK